MERRGEKNNSFMLLKCPPNGLAGEAALSGALRSHETKEGIDERAQKEGVVSIKTF